MIAVVIPIIRSITAIFSSYRRSLGVIPLPLPFWRLCSAPLCPNRPIPDAPRLIIRRDTSDHRPIALKSFLSRLAFCCPYRPRRAVAAHIAPEILSCLNEVSILSAVSTPEMPCFQVYFGVIGLLLAMKLRVRNRGEMEVVRQLSIGGKVGNDRFDLRAFRPCLIGLTCAPYGIHRARLSVAIGRTGRIDATADYRARKQ